MAVLALKRYLFVSRDVLANQLIATRFTLMHKFCTSIDTDLSPTLWRTHSTLIRDANVVWSSFQIGLALLTLNCCEYASTLILTDELPGAAFQESFKGCFPPYFSAAPFERRNIFEATARIFSCLLVTVVKLEDLRLF